MRRNFALPGAPRVSGRSAASSCACLAFVLLMALAFWAGALWISESALALFFSGR